MMDTPHKMKPQKARSIECCFSIFNVHGNCLGSKTCGYFQVNYIPFIKSYICAVVEATLHSKMTSHVKDRIPRCKEIHAAASM